jgi:hypothetical protein
MSIDKNSSGLPMVDSAKKTTRVNFAVAGGIIIFLAITLGVVIFYSSGAPKQVNAPSPPLSSQPTGTPPENASPSKK